MTSKHLLSNILKKKKRSYRYFENAKEILSKSPIEDSAYADVKYVQEACSPTYLAVLKAIDEYLLNKGLTKKELPRSVDAYREMIRKHIAIRNGKLLREFERLYEELHIAGYYSGNLSHTKVVKEAFKSAKEFIEKIK